jgi:hypothetical protein
VRGEEDEIEERGTVGKTTPTTETRSHGEEQLLTADCTDKRGLGEESYARLFSVSQCLRGGFS